MKRIDGRKLRKRRRIFHWWSGQPKPEPVIGPTLRRMLEIDRRGKLFAVPRAIDEDALLAQTRGYRRDE